MVGLQQTLLEAVTGHSAALESDTAGTRRLREAMEARNCLLVLDDARELEHVQAFDALGLSSHVIAPRPEELASQLAGPWAESPSPSCAPS